MITKINGVYSLTDEADVLNLPTKGVQIGSIAQLTKDNGDSTVYIFTKDMSTENTSWVKVPDAETSLTEDEKANVALIPDIKADIREVRGQLDKKANKDDIGQPTQEQVNAWLNNNPQATTTVQDNSITPIKFSEILKNSLIENYENKQFTTIDGYYSINDGNLNVDSYFKSTEFYVNAYEVYEITNTVVGNVAHCLCLNANNEIIKKIHGEYIESETTYTSKIEIPLGCTKIRCSGIVNKNFIIKKLLSVSLNSGTEETILKDKQNLFIREYDSKGMDFKPFDKHKFVLIVDDGSEQTPDIYKICHELNVPMSVAVPWNRLSTIYTRESNPNNLSIKDFCKLIEKDGGEVLSHGWTVITDTSTEEDYIDAFVTEKQKMQENGFACRGKILIGGPDYIYNDPRTDKWVKLNYEYSDLYGLSSSKMYSLNRLWFVDWQNLNNFKGKINEILSMENKGLFLLAMHGSNDENNFEHYTKVKELLEYLKTINEIELTTISKVYDEYAYAKYN